MTWYILIHLIHNVNKQAHISKKIDNMRQQIAQSEHISSKTKKTNETNHRIFNHAKSRYFTLDHVKSR